MPQPPLSPKIAPPPVPNLSLTAGVLSYLVPGLGQIYQGRTGKGLLFLVCLYGMFFYGMYLGDWKNVYLPDMAATKAANRNHRRGDRDGNRSSALWELANNLYSRIQFVGQVWIGVAAWPALWQYNNLPVPSEKSSPFWHNFQRTPPEKRQAEPLFRDRVDEGIEHDGDEAPRDRDMGPHDPDEAPWDWKDKTVNELQTEGDKTWDLGWVYTVIAGVLNVLVIYDAAAGPALGATGLSVRRTPSETAPA
jgi:hypothetical protein